MYCIIKKKDYLYTIENKTLINMLHVIITKEEIQIIGAKKIGITSGKKNPQTGKREKIYFCTNLDFIKSGIQRDKKFIEI